MRQPGLSPAAYALHPGRKDNLSFAIRLKKTVPLSYTDRGTNHRGTTLVPEKSPALDPEPDQRKNVSEYKFNIHTCFIPLPFLSLTRLNAEAYCMIFQPRGAEKRKSLLFFRCEISIRPIRPGSQPVTRALFRHGADESTLHRYHHFFIHVTIQSLICNSAHHLRGGGTSCLTWLKRILAHYKNDVKTFSPP